MRFSEQRESILNVVLNSDNHPTADYIYSKLKKNYPGLSLGTVYRNLSLLSEKGLIQKISIPNHSDKFDKKLYQHAHMICDACGEVYDIDIDPIYNIISNISDQNNMLIKSYNITFNGICNKCNDKKD